MFSFVNGMQSFPTAIANQFGNKILYNSDITNIHQEKNKWVITFTNNGKEKNIESDILFTAIPSYKLSKILVKDYSELSNHLDAIYYPPVLVLYLGYNKNEIKQQLDGFGFLIPSKEKKNYLGAIWSSVIFKNRATKDKAAFTIFIGGARNPNLSENNIDITIEKVLKEFQTVMGIKTKPIIIEKMFWQKAIPQYNVGYIEHEKYFDNFEKKHPGIFIGGNFRGGISVGDCIKNSYLNFEKIKNYLK
jgi:oxygen-dependent protoporphyrinogen oxidase